VCRTSREIWYQGRKVLRVQVGALWGVDLCYKLWKKSHYLVPLKGKFGNIQLCNKPTLCPRKLHLIFISACWIKFSCCLSFSLSEHSTNRHEMYFKWTVSREFRYFTQMFTFQLYALRVLYLQPVTFPRLSNQNALDYLFIFKSVICIIIVLHCNIYQRGSSISEW
jgi:hypothetical protein